jgi:hypothetical protein
MQRQQEHSLATIFKIMKKDLSVEYAHIYTNQKIASEHALSLEVLSEVRSQNKDAKISLVVMVDDYSFPDPTFSYSEFTKWLTEHNHKPNVLIRESQLIPTCDSVITEIEDQELASELENYIKNKKYPCSLFIASWYLVRLGVLPSTFFPQTETAEKLLNILPQSFRPYEDKALDIISKTQFKDLVPCIENRYFEGRPI